MTWRIHNPRNGLWYDVVNEAGISFEVARESSAKILVEYLNSMKRLADFGANCVQDDCEGAWIAATVHNKVKRDLQEALTHLQSLLEVGSVVQRDDEIIKNNRRRDAARKFIEKTKGQSQ